MSGNRLLITACIAAIFLLSSQAIAEDGPRAGGDRILWQLRIHVAGTSNPDAWHHPSADQQAEQVAELKKNADQAQLTEHLKLKLTETTHFLIYSDSGIGANSAREDGICLEAAYTTLGRLLTEKPATDNQGADVWRGKAVFYIFSDSDIAREFSQLLHPYYQPEHDSSRLPLITFDRSGRVDVIAVQLEPSDMYMRNLVTAAAVGYVFRFHAPGPVAPWVEAGVAVGVTDEVHYPARSGTPNWQPRLANVSSRLRRDDLAHILDSQYPDPQFDEAIIGFLSRRSAPQLSVFVQDLKDGKSWQDSLSDAYQLDPATLKAAYLKANPVQP